MRGKGKARRGTKRNVHRKKNTECLQKKTDVEEESSDVIEDDEVSNVIIKSEVDTNFDGLLDAEVCGETKSQTPVTKNPKSPVEESGEHYNVSNTESVTDSLHNTKVRTF